MGLISGIKRQLRSVIQWEDPGPDELFSRWSDNGDEIKNASKLIVGPGQGCLFVYEGKIAAVLEQEGMVELATANIPFWTTVSRVMQAFQSEHKVAIYFFTRRAIVDQKWGTASPVKYEEPRYGFPAALRAHGNFSWVMHEPEGFFRALVGGQAWYRVSDLRIVLANRIVQTISDYLAEARPPYLEIDARRAEIAHGIQEKLGPEFVKFGIELLDFRIEGAEFDEETRARVRQIGDRIAAMQEAKVAGMSYADVQRLDALRDAARNEGGAAGAGVGIGAGIALGNTLAGSVAGAVPGASSIESRLAALQQLLDKKLISADEYARTRAQILSAL